MVDTRTTTRHTVRKRDVNDHKRMGRARTTTATAQSEHSQVCSGRIEDVVMVVGQQQTMMNDLVLCALGRTERTKVCACGRAPYRGSNKNSPSHRCYLTEPGSQTSPE